MANNVITRADKYTALSKKQVTWSDFTLNLAVHPDTGDLFLITNDNAVKSDLRNLVLTSFFERFQQPTFGCSVRQTLFENFNPQTDFLIQSTIKNAIANFETRVTVISVGVVSDPDNYDLTITIVFTINNVPQIQTLAITVTRIR